MFAAIMTICVVVALLGIWLLADSLHNHRRGYLHDFGHIAGIIMIFLGLLGIASTMAITEDYRREIDRIDYSRVAKFQTEHPDYKFLVEKAMEDGKINVAEYKKIESVSNRLLLQE